MAKTLEELRAEAAKKEESVKAIETQIASATSGKAGQLPQWTPTIALGLSLSILVFGLLVLALMCWMLLKTRDNLNGLLRAFALILIIVAAIFLIVAGYTEQQIAPAMGLLGTIAGYLLNTAARQEKDEGPNQPAPPPPAQPLER
jgi:4-amino-4-deoxy-L-arabinose transferase-like glycosyltransferase